MLEVIGTLVTGYLVWVGIVVILASVAIVKVLLDSKK
jgi:hypothetical protein